MLWSDVDPYFFVKRHELESEKNPHVIIAGDSYSWTITTPDYSAATYGMTLYLRGKDALTLNAIATGSAGTDFGFVLNAQQTAKLQSGQYDYTYRITSGSAFAHTLKSGHMPVEPNLALMGPGDGESVAAKCLAMIEARLENRLTADMELFMIAGRQITRIPIKELMELRAKFAREVYHQRYGMKNGIPVEVQFTRVRY